MFLCYQRVSTREQAADGSTSIAEQERKAQAIAQLRGADTYDIANYTDTGVSGSIALYDRPAGQRLLMEMQPGDTIIATKLDRLFRSAVDALSTAEDLRKQRIHLILIDMGTEPVTDNGVAKMFFGMMALVAEFERERINERTDDGRKAKRKINGHCGGAPPYGFTVVGEGRQAMLVPNEPEREIIRQIKEMVARDWPPSWIKRALDERGIVTRAGKPFLIHQVQRLAGRELAQ